MTAVALFTLNEYILIKIHFSDLLQISLSICDDGLAYLRRSGPTFFGTQRIYASALFDSNAMIPYLLPENKKAPDKSEHIAQISGAKIYKI